MSNRISRRELGLAAMAGTAMAQSDVAAKHAGALEGFEGRVDAAEFDPVAWSRERYKAAPLRLAFRAKDRKDAEKWQKKLREKVAELLGGFPQSRGPLKATALESRDFPAYRRERLVFESRPGVSVLAFLISPTQVKAPLATVICVPGHGRGVEDIVGIDEAGRDRTDRPGYQHDFALQVAEHGMAALAIEPLAFGCRRDPVTRKKGLGSTACYPAAGAALLFSETMIGWRVWDVMRAIDWIATRPDLDARRVGCMGISGGGTCTLFAAALDTRIKAAFVSGYLNTFRDSILSLSHCIDNYVPGILNWAEMYDVAGLIAPRALFSEGGDRDPIFPVAAARESFERVREMYKVFGAGGAVEQEIFSGVHEFHGERGLPFLAKALGA
jgi:dienelactone hydrolase